jgi:hypothetical protein
MGNEADETVVELWEDNAGGLHLVGTDRVWAFISTPGTALFGVDSLEMQTGDDRDWVDVYGDADSEDRPTPAQFYADREAEAGNPNGMKLVAVRTAGGRINLTDAYRGHNARTYLGLEGSEQ